MAAVYWIQKDGDTDILTQGYVGFTSRDPEIRKGEHERVRPGTFHVIAEGSEEDMLALEAKLRPESYIGDNIAPGGFRGGGNHRRTDETKERMRQARLGTSWNTKVKKKISQTLKGSMMWITKGTDNRLVPSNRPIPEGWRRGRYRKTGLQMREVVWEGKTYESLKACAKANGMTVPTMHRRLKKTNVQ